MAHRAEVQANFLVISGQLETVDTGLLGTVVGAKVILREVQERG